MTSDFCSLLRKTVCPLDQIQCGALVSRQVYHSVCSAFASHSLRIRFANLKENFSVEKRKMEMGIETFLYFIVQKEKLYRACKTTVSVLAFLIIFTNYPRKLASLLSGKFYLFDVLKRLKIKGW